ncbi:MAG TPA: 2'-5' RNA ligase family protein [Stellaceae bacterium]
MEGRPGPLIRVAGGGAAAGNGSAAPLILTLAMDAASFERFGGMRRRYFPPERNVIPAHVTLFHHLPGGRLADVAATVEAVCAGQDGPLAVMATGLRFLGRGVAYALDSPELEALRCRLATAWEPWLTAQDRQRFRPHVTVQNKVAPAVARALHDQLQAAFAPFRVDGEGLLLWRYLGGPWEQVAAFAFPRAD